MTMHSSIQLREFYNAQWTKGGAPRIQLAGDFANKLAYWLSLQIVSEPKPKDQLKAWGHVLHVGKVCFVYNI